MCLDVSTYHLTVTNEKHFDFLDNRDFHLKTCHDYLMFDKYIKQYFKKILFNLQHLYRFNLKGGIRFQKTYKRKKNNSSQWFCTNDLFIFTSQGKIYLQVEKFT